MYKVFIVSVFVILGACTKNKPITAKEYVEPLPWEDDSCWFNKNKIDLTPVQMVTKYVEDDFQSKRLHTETVPEFLEYCPNQFPGGDTIEVISAYKLVENKIEKDNASVVVEYTTIGSVFGVGNENFIGFEKDVKKRKVTFKLVQTPYGWRIEDREIGSKVSNKKIQWYFEGRKWERGKKEEYQKAVKEAQALG